MTANASTLMMEVPWKKKRLINKAIRMDRMKRMKKIEKDPITVSPKSCESVFIYSGLLLKGITLAGFSVPCSPLAEPAFSDCFSTEILFTSPNLMG